MSRNRALFLVLFFILGACSLRSAIDALSTPEDRAFAQDFVAKMRSGDVKSLQPLFDEQTWVESEPQLARAQSYYPDSPGTTELIGFHIQSNNTNGVASQSKDYTLVTNDGSHWTTTLIRTQSSQGGPHRIVGWNVTGGPEMPPAYRQYQSMEAAIPWMWGGGLFGLLLFGGLIFWLVRRSRRKHAPVPGQGSGTP